MTRIKICGIGETEHASAAAEAGAHFLGLVFAPSRRQITPERGKEIVLAVKGLKHPPLVAGVFVNALAEGVNSIASYCGLDLVQLSGDESWVYSLTIEKPVIKVIHVADQSSQEISAELKCGRKALGTKDFICLLDSGESGVYGGTGKTFDWQVASEVSRNFRVVVAGGLTPENVGEAIRVSQPWGVDVSSGVETGGIKDIRKIVAFVEAVRKADARLGQRGKI